MSETKNVSTQSTKKIAFLAVIAFAGLTLIAATTLPATLVYAQQPQNPKTTESTQTLPFRLNPQGDQIPGRTEITTTTTEACTGPGGTPPGQSPQNGECKSPQYTYSCEQTVTTRTFNPGGVQQSSSTETTQC